MRYTLRRRLKAAGQIALLLVAWAIVMVIVLTFAMTIANFLYLDTEYAVLLALLLIFLIVGGANGLMEIFE